MKLKMESIRWKHHRASRVFSKQCVVTKVPRRGQNEGLVAEGRMELEDHESGIVSHLQSPVLEATTGDGWQELHVQFPYFSGLGLCPLG